MKMSTFKVYSKGEAFTKPINYHIFEFLKDLLQDKKVKDLLLNLLDK